MRLKKKQIQKFLDQYPELSIRQIREYWSAFEMFVHDVGKFDALADQKSLFNDQSNDMKFLQTPDSPTNGSMVMTPSKTNHHGGKEPGTPSRSGADDEEDAITIEQLGAVMRRMFQNPTERELLDMVREVDTDGNGNIEFSEFVTLMATSNKKLDSVFEMNEAFRVFDQENQGFITKDALRRVFMSIGCALTEEECEMMIKEVDKTGTGTIHKEDFVKLMQMSNRDIMKMNDKRSRLRAIMFR